MNGVDYDRDAKQFRLKLITINQIVRNLILLFLSLYIYTYTCFFYDDAHVNSKKKKKRKKGKKKGGNFLIFTAVALSASETATKVVGKRLRKGRDSVTGRSVPLFPVVRHSNRVHNARGATTLPNWKMEQAGTAGGAHRNATLPPTPPPVLSITYLTRYARLIRLRSRPNAPATFYFPSSSVAKPGGLFIFLSNRSSSLAREQIGYFLLLHGGNGAYACEYFVFVFLSSSTPFFHPSFIPRKYAEDNFKLLIEQSALFSKEVGGDIRESSRKCLVSNRTHRVGPSFSWIEERVDGEGMEVYRDRFERDRGIKYPGKILDRGLNDS